LPAGSVGFALVQLLLHVSRLAVHAPSLALRIA